MNIKADIIEIAKAQLILDYNCQLSDFEKSVFNHINLLHLDTFDFQAKDFYLKHGYEVFGVLDDCPMEHKRYYMKRLYSKY
ncbi:hypothetical protein [Clostridium sp. C2-6-12]|uniref:hypothetical protein n=1 Tax=Clostridium sp. C2-6-12 TaxID=2698832 RepID=UPI001923F531|nr:hypothetical protein [Clostridium sp. C2-6-12]